MHYTKAYEVMEIYLYQYFIPFISIRNPITINSCVSRYFHSYWFSNFYQFKFPKQMFKDKGFSTIFYCLLWAFNQPFLYFEYLNHLISFRLNAKVSISIFKYFANLEFFSLHFLLIIFHLMSNLDAYYL